MRIHLGGVHKLCLQDLSFFDHLPPSVYIFYGIKVYKKSIFLTTYPPPLVNVVCERPLSCISDFLERSLFLGNWTFSEFFGVHGNICRKLDFPPLKWPGARMSRRILSFKNELSKYYFSLFVCLIKGSGYLANQSDV